MPALYLLKPGSIKRDARGAILDARSSSTLILSQGCKIVVDTGQRGDEEAILQALGELRIGPEEIDILVNTHCHSDHCSNNHLFCRARTLAPAAEGEIIAPGVRVLSTPGHSPDSISVVVRAEETVVLAGDALPTMGNYLKKVPPALHTDRNLALASMIRIMEIADIVVPGHDLPFSLGKDAYVALPFQIGSKEH
jgi:glyoxylase-like metal-dependent hydrolase (beta-lactamase superfamily II)